MHCRCRFLKDISFLLWLQDVIWEASRIKRCFYASMLIAWCNPLVWLFSPCLSLIITVTMIPSQDHDKKHSAAAGVAFIGGGPDDVKDDYGAKEDGRDKDGAGAWTLGPRWARRAGQRRRGRESAWYVEVRKLLCHSVTFKRDNHHKWWKPRKRLKNVVFGCNFDADTNFTLTTTRKNRISVTPNMDSAKIIGQIFDPIRPYLQDSWLYTYRYGLLPIILVCIWPDIRRLVAWKLNSSSCAVSLSGSGNNSFLVVYLPLW